MGNCNYCTCIDEKTGLVHHEMRNSVDINNRPTSTMASGREFRQSPLVQLETRKQSGANQRSQQ